MLFPEVVMNLLPEGRDCVDGFHNHSMRKSWVRGYAKRCGNAQKGIESKRTSTRAISKSGEILADCVDCELVNRPFQFQKCSQYFFGTNDEMLSVAMRVHNPNCPPFAVQS